MATKKSTQSEATVPLSEAVKKIVSSLKVTGKNYQMSATDLKKWAEMLQGLDKKVLRQTAVELVAVEERMLELNKETSALAREQLGSLVSILVQRLKTPQKWGGK